MHHAQTSPPPITLPGPGEVRVWWVPSAATALDTAVLSAVERERAARYHRQEDHNRFVVGAVLVRCIGAAAVGATGDPAQVTVDRRCRRCGGDHGRPLLPGRLQVSVTHSGGWVGVAGYLDGAVGLDLEAELPPVAIDGIRTAVLAPGEECGPGGLLTRWTRKEAVLKASGHGLNVAPREVIIAEGPDGPRVQAFDRWPEPRRWRLHALDGPPGTVGSLATWADPAPTVREVLLAAVPGCLPSANARPPTR